MGPHDWLGEMAVNGLLAEIDLSDVADQFLPSAVAAFVYEGVQYGMPTSAENVGFLRNTDLVPKNPATWDDVRAISENKLVAETFVLDYVGTPEGIESLYSASPRPAAMIEVREAMDDEITVGVANAGAEGLTMPAIPEMSSVWSARGNAMESLRTSELDAETAFSNAGAIIGALPSLAIYLMLQDQIVGGLTQGAVKG